MTKDIASAEAFVEAVDLPQYESAGARRGGTAEIVSVGQEQATVVGSDVVSFTDSVDQAMRQAIVDSMLLAQLVAKHKVGDPTQIYDWYEAYFETLSNVGWVIQDQGFAEYTEASDGFEAHKAILSIAETLLGAANPALSIVKSTLKSLREVEEGSPWITIFNREAKHANTARFQVSLADSDVSGHLVTLIAFGLTARTQLTQVLFVKIFSNEAEIKHTSGKVSVNGEVLGAVHPKIREKILAYQSEFVRDLPAFG